MFQSVLEQDLPQRNLGRAALLALGFHAAALATVVCVSSGVRHAPSSEPNPLRVLIPPSPTRMLAAGMVQLVDSPPAARPTTKAPRRPDTVVPTTRSVETPPPADEPPSGSTGSAAAVAAAVGSGSAHGDGAATGSADGSVDARPAAPPSRTFEVLPWGEGMTAPVLIFKQDPVYTREAAASHEEGTILL